MKRFQASYYFHHLRQALRPLWALSEKGGQGRTIGSAGAWNLRSTFMFHALADGIMWDKQTASIRFNKVKKMGRTITTLGLMAKRLVLRINSVHATQQIMRMESLARREDILCQCRIWILRISKCLRFWVFLSPDSSSCSYFTTTRHVPVPNSIDLYYVNIYEAQDRHRSWMTIYEWS